MTVNTTNIISGPYTGNGAADTYSYTFRVDDKTQLEVREYTDLGVESILTVDVDYTVTDVGVDGGGTVIRLAGNLPTDYQWYIRADYKLTQLIAFASQGGFFPYIHEEAVDKITFLIQQLQEEIDRCVKVTVISGDDPSGLVASIEASAAAAAVSAAAAAADLVLTNADVVLTNADVVSAAAEVLLAAAEVTYASEWANKAEDSLVSAAAGGDEVDDYSAKHFSLKAATSAATAADLSNTVSGTNTYTATLGIGAYVTGKTYHLTFTNTNTSTTCTLNLDGLGAKSMKDSAGLDIPTSNIPEEALVRYDGTNMVLLNPLSRGGGVFVTDTGAPLISTTVFDLDAALPNNTWESFGATGSGKTNIWTALDSVPSDVDWIEVKGRLYCYTTAAEFTSVTLAARPNGSSDAFSDITTIGYTGVTVTGSGSTGVGSTGWYSAKINVSSLSFDLLIFYGATAVTCNIALVGYGYN